MVCLALLLLGAAVLCMLAGCAPVRQPVITDIRQDMVRVQLAINPYVSPSPEDMQRVH